MFRQYSLTLIGMPGCGKTFWGKRLSEWFKIPFIDIDDLIVKRAGGLSLPSILSASSNGERDLQQLENKCLQEVLYSKLNVGTPHVISTGGSAIYSDCAVEFFNHPSNFVVHLDVPMDVLEQRTEQFTNRGIVFNGMTPTELKESRDILYRQYADLSMYIHHNTDLVDLLSTEFQIPNPKTVIPKRYKP